MKGGQPALLRAESEIRARLRSDADAALVKLVSAGLSRPEIMMRTGIGSSKLHRDLVRLGLSAKKIKTQAFPAMKTSIGYRAEQSALRKRVAFSSR